MSNPNPTPLNKIAAIQGLRALCVILVLIFHVDKNLLPSGYLGVDAFFAISGFVITLLIFRQKTSNSFSYSRFYISRAIRLLPSLFITVLATLLVFYVAFGINSDLNNLADSAIAATLSVSNIYYFFDAGYFSSDSIYKPLLHTWSLGVEEQFYLLFPLFILFVLRFSHTIKIISAVCFLGFVTTYIKSDLHTDMVFFLSPFRVYQFLLGTIFALASLKPVKQISSRVSSIVLHWIFPVTLTFLCTQTYVAGKEQILVQSFTALIISFACYLAAKQHDLAETYKHKAELLNTSLASKIGDYSYQIYLVHWPIIVGLFIYSNGAYADSTLLKLVALFTSLLFGICLYLLINKTFRYQKKDKKSRRKQLYTILVLTLVCVGLSGFYKAKSARIVTSAKLQELTLETPASKYCNLSLKKFLHGGKGFSSHCLMKPDNNIKRVLVIGDSLNVGIRNSFRKYKQELVINSVSLSGCSPYFGKNEQQLKFMKDMFTRCRTPKGFPWAMSLIEQFFEEYQYDAIVLSGNWYAKNLSVKNMAESLTELDKLNVPVYLFGLRPLFNEEVPRILEKHFAKTDKSPEHSKKLHVKKSGETQDQRNEKLKNLVNDFSNIEFFDVKKTLCPKDCPIANIKHKPLYKDKMHLSKAGVKYLAYSKQFIDLVESLKNLTISEGRACFEIEYLES